MRRVLILGYSVTADKSGFAEFVRSSTALSGMDIEVDVCGVGGLNPLTLAVLYEGHVKRYGRYDYVFLEIATSIFGTKITDWAREGLDLFYDLCERIQASSARVALINLYRDDFNYPYHVFDMVLESLATRYELPLLDLAAGLIRREGRDFCRSLLRDVVHTNTIGAEYQAQKVCEFIKSVVQANKPQRHLPDPQYKARAIDFAPASLHRPPYVFSRSGLQVDCGVLHAGESCELVIPPGARVYGISFISGPVSGEFTLSFSGIAKPIVVQTYDEHCYYSRYNFRSFPPITGGQAVSVNQTDGLPSYIKLAKGEPDTSARVGRLGALHYFEENLIRDT